MRGEPTGELLRQLLDASSDGLLALDVNGTIVAANESAAALLVREREHLIGKPFAAFVPLEARRVFRHAFDQVLRNEPATLDVPLPGGRGRATATLRRVQRADGPHVTVTLLSGAGTVREDREPAAAKRTHNFYMRMPHAVVGVNADLSVAFANPRARHFLGSRAVQHGKPLGEAKIAIDLRALGERAVARTAPLLDTPLELPDGRLIRVVSIPAAGREPAVLMFEDVTAQHRHDRVMREFVRNAAHQLRTPLTGITTAVEVLQAGAKDVPEDRDRFLEHIERHAARLTRIARALLVLARAQSGEQLLRLEFIELRPLLESLAAEASPPPGVTFETDCAPSLAALAEPNLMHEALSALVDNAVAHTREGSVRLVAHEVDGRVEIEVIDNGHGLLPEHEARIFEPFYRAFEHGDGFGLGLAIASQAAEAMNGELLAASIPEGGTRFSIRLPSARVVG